MDKGLKRASTYRQQAKWRFTLRTQDDDDDENDDKDNRPMINKW